MSCYKHIFLITRNIMSFSNVKTKIALLSSVFIILLSSLSANAKGDLTKQTPIEIKVILGDKDNAMKFSPSIIELETGKLYKMVIENQGPVKHYFSSDGFSQSVLTRKVQVNNNGGAPIAEIKGTIREVEVYPGFQAQWWFVPVKTGTFRFTL